MSSPTVLDRQAGSARRVPMWLVYSLLTIVFWGVWGALSKVVADHMDAYMNQVLFTLGLIPPAAVVLWKGRLRGGSNPKRGFFYAFLTGILGGTGNIAFVKSMNLGGQASIVVPATSMSPLITVLLAYFMLRERMTRLQMVGVVCALAAIYLLSV